MSFSIINTMLSVKSCSVLIITRMGDDDYLHIFSWRVILLFICLFYAVMGVRRILLYMKHDIGLYGNTYMGRGVSVWASPGSRVVTWRTEVVGGGDGRCTTTPHTFKGASPPTDTLPHALATPRPTAITPLPDTRSLFYSWTVYSFQKSVSKAAK